MQKSEKFWGQLSMFLILLYVTVGGGYEIYKGVTMRHVQSSFIFSFLSALIFVGRIFYARATGARRTIIADIYGALVMLSISILNIFFNF